MPSFKPNDIIISDSEDDNINPESQDYNKAEIQAHYLNHESLPIDKQKIES